jgi:hypothetical protein
MNMIFSCMRLLLIVPRLQSPRQAAYFEREDSMVEELPLFCYSSDCIGIHLWGTVCLHALIAIVFNFDFLAKYASQLGAKKVLQKAIDELKNDQNSDDKWEEHVPYFYFLPRQVVLECKTQSLPPMQVLRDVGLLEKKKIKLIDAFNGVGDINNTLFVSHRWEERGQPDVDGAQLKAMKAYLEAHPEIKWVWFDYSSMPQRVSLIHSARDWRTPKELAEFHLMLAAITDMYLTARILILLDTSYVSRFWTLTEAWCSMQKATRDGLKPATEDEQRYTIKCIHNATEKHDGEGLVEKVSEKTPEEMYGILKKPDVNVTNAKDKEAMLPKILEYDSHVKDMFAKMEKHADHDQGAGADGSTRRQDAGTVSAF